MLCSDDANIAQQGKSQGNSPFDVHIKAQHPVQKEQIANYV